MSSIPPPPIISNVGNGFVALPPTIFPGSNVIGGVVPPAAPVKKSRKKKVESESEEEEEDEEDSDEVSDSDDDDDDEEDSDDDDVTDSEDEDEDDEDEEDSEDEDEEDSDDEEEESGKSGKSSKKSTPRKSSGGGFVQPVFFIPDLKIDENFVMPILPPLTPGAPLIKPVITVKTKASPPPKGKGRGKAVMPDFPQLAPVSTSQTLQQKLGITTQSLPLLKQEALDRYMVGQATVDDYLTKGPEENDDTFKLRTQLTYKIREKRPDIDLALTVLIGSMCIKKMLFGVTFPPNVEVELTSILQVL